MKYTQLSRITAIFNIYKCLNVFDIYYWLRICSNSWKDRKGTNLCSHLNGRDMNECFISRSRGSQLVASRIPRRRIMDYRKPYCYVKKRNMLYDLKYLRLYLPQRDKAWIHECRFKRYTIIYEELLPQIF